MKTKLKILPIIILVFTILLGSVYSVYRVNAAAGFAELNDNWSKISNKMSEEAMDTYPYDGSLSADSKITSVSLDILYGTTRDLVYYHGEVPERETTTNDGKYVDAFEGVFYRNGTTLQEGAEVNPGKVSAKEYWGFDEKDTSILPLDSNYNATRNDMQNVNSNEIISLRLYSLANTKTPGLISLYGVFKGAAWLSTGVIKYIIIAKNIDMDVILDLLGLDNIAKLLKDSFIYDHDHSKLSAFMGLCIIMFIFSLVSFVYRYAKGLDKENGLVNILTTAFIGFFIIGMCLTGRISTLGSSFADMASQLMYMTAGTLSEDGDGKTFTTMITDSKNTNKIVQLQESSMINKSYIKLQICTQFGVNDIDDLKFAKFGDKDGTVAKDKLSGISDADLEKDFSNNLGYYYWYANSSATKKTSLNKTYPSTNTNAVKKKLNSMITYLQTTYNTARANSDSKTQENIKNIILSFASPNGAKGCLVMLIYVGTLALLAVCLFKYAVSVLVSKLELFASLVGLTLAGPMMLTNNKTLVQTGKNILGMLAVSFINITVYSTIFDVILYVIATMISTNVAQLLITLAAVFLLMKFNPIIEEKIKQMLETAERTISPTLAQSKRAIKNWSRTKYNDTMRAYDNSQKCVGVDENGNPIYEKRGGNLLSKAMHHAGNEIFNEGDRHEGFLKIQKESNEMRHNNTTASANNQYKAAHNKTEAVNEQIDNEAKDLKDSLEANYDKLKDEVIQKLENGEKQYDVTKLSAKEKDLYDQLTNAELAIEGIKNSDEYKKLIAEQIKMDDDPLYLTKEERDAITNRLQRLNFQINCKNQVVRSSKCNLDEEIDIRLTKKSFANKGYDYDSIDGDTKDDKIEYITKMTAQNKHKDELRKCLKDELEAAERQADLIKTGKIGATRTSVNTTAVSNRANIEFKLADLDNGEIVKDHRKESEEIAKTIAHKYHNNDVSDVAAAVGKDVVAHAHISKAKRAKDVAKARENTKEVVGNVVQNTAKNISTDFNVKKDKVVQSKNVTNAVKDPCISEQITFLVNQHRSAAASTATTSTSSSTSSTSSTSGTSSSGTTSTK